MKGCNSTKKKLLQKLQETLPEFVKPKEIEALKIFGVKNTLMKDRRSGKGLPYIEIAKNRVVYPKEDVIRYISECFHDIEGNSE